MKNKKPTKGEDLRTRIMVLFQKAGFEVTPKDKDDKEVEVEISPGKIRPIDLLAKTRGLKIMIECTGKDLKSVTAYIHDKSKIAKTAKFDKVLLVITNKDIKKEDLDYVRKQDGEIWTEKEIRYYEAIVSAIGEWAKYEIIHSLGLHTDEEKTIHNVYALKIKQPLIDSQADIFLFSINPEFLLKTGVIFRKARSEAATYQRMLRKPRLPKIASFVSKQNAIFPVDIIVSLGDKVKSSKLDSSKFCDSNGDPIAITHKNAEVHVLQLPLEYSSLEIIDGQHRLFGFAKVPEDNIRKTFNLIVAGIKRMDFSQRRDLFVSINDNSRRVDPNLVAYLKYTDEENECKQDSELMAIKITVELNKIKPFQNKIKLLDVGKEKITLKGFSGYHLKGLVSKEGLLRKYYPNNESKEYIAILATYFSIVKDIFKNQWNNPKEYIVATNRGISAFLQLLGSIMITKKAKPDHNDFRKYIEPLKCFNFETEHLTGKYIGAAGWKKFHEDLLATIRKDYPDFGKK